MQVDLQRLQQKRTRLEEEIRRREEEARALQSKLDTLAAAEAILLEDDDSRPSNTVNTSASNPPLQEPAKRRGGQRTGTSEIVREIAKSFNGPFTIRDVMAVAERSENPKYRKLDERSATSTLFNWCQQGRLEQVVERRGNKPSIYRIKGNELDEMTRRKSKRALEFPLTDMIVDTARAMGTTFSKADLFDQLLKRYPKYENRFKLDSVGAKLNTLATNGKGVRFVERNHQGNTYGHI